MRRIKTILQSGGLLGCISLLWAMAFALQSSSSVLAQIGPEETPVADPMGANASAQAYLPLVRIRVSPPTDISIGGVEITQGIQTTANTVPQVAGKATLFRIYTSVANSGPVGNVRLTIHAQRNGSNLAGSPMTIGPVTIPTTYSRAVFSSSINANLPTAWLSGQVYFRIEVDSNHAIAERFENNNTAEFSVNFTDVPAMNIKAVPFNYYDSGLNFPPAGTGYLNAGLTRLYPIAAVNRTVRQPVDIECNLNQGGCWNSTLDDLTSLKSTDGSPWYQFYYGIVPLEDASSTICWFNGGTAGLGWYPQPRVSMGLANSADCLADFDTTGGEIAAHELGHNMGRLHAPCGVSGDIHYPYSGGSIGQYGVDISPMLLLAPTIYSDIMGYCNNQWISDYTYNALFAKLIEPQADLPAAGPALLVRAGFEGETLGKLEPAYIFTGNPAPAAAGSDYAVEYLDAAGKVVGSYPIAVLTAEEPGIQVRRINSLVPLPEAAFTTYRIVRLGEALAQRVLATPAATSQALEAVTVQVVGDALRLSWGASSVPAVVRYTADGSLSWTTVALDHIGGSLSVPLNQLPGGVLQFEIIPSDRLESNLTIDFDHSVP